VSSVEYFGDTYSRKNDAEKSVSFDDGGDGPAGGTGDGSGGDCQTC